MAEYTALGFVAIFGSATAFTLFMLARNSWVFKQRMKLIRQSAYDPATNTLSPYASLPSYEAMLWRFWIWDINKFIGGAA
ncbi:MAG: hypothetical protein ABW043_16930 [Devosia sp.]|uniref:hypothetical protein n=1 Tax=Devosia sp. TaxID=1871048 RepID=UPI0033976A58